MTVKEAIKPITASYIVDLWEVDKGIEIQTQCPICGFAFVIRQITKSTGNDEIVYDERSQCCPICGQAIDWSETE